MLFWIASYPKSGNTWLRSLITTYFFTEDGVFNFKLLKNIPSYPSPFFFKDYKDKFDTPESTAKYWISEQEKINVRAKNSLTFLKTHNALCKINGYSFTNSINSIGAIYIIRDPRNVISSISNHYQVQLTDAFNFMKDKNKALVFKEDERFLGFNALFSWSLNLRSWVECKKFPVLTIRYEDLDKNCYLTFEKILKFIIKTANLKEAFNEKKAIMAVKTCHFDRLQSLEKEEGFDEAVNKRGSSEKIKFFNLGTKNNYKNLLDEKLINEMNKLYEVELKMFNYK